MAGIIKTASKSDLMFLEDLDKRLHYVKRYGVRLSGKVDFDSFLDGKRIKGNEAERILRTVRENVDLVLYPINTN